MSEKQAAPIAMPADSIINAAFLDYCSDVYPGGVHGEQAKQLQMVWYGAFAAAIRQFSRMSHLPGDQQIAQVERLQSEVRTHCMAVVERDVPGGRA